MEKAREEITTRLLDYYKDWLNKLDDEDFELAVILSALPMQAIVGFMRRHKPEQFDDKGVPYGEHWGP